MKYCENCGKKVKGEEEYCLKCGASLKKEVKVVKTQSSVPVIGILSIVFCLFPVVGIVLGIIGLINAGKNKEQKSLFITSLIGLIASVVMFIAVIALAFILYFLSDAEYEHQFEDSLNDSNYSLSEEREDDEEFEYPYGYGIEDVEEVENKYDVSAFKSVTVKELVQNIEDGKTYVVYIGREGCHYCGEFLPILEEAQDKHNYKTYYIDLDNYLNYNTGSIYGMDDLKKFDSFIEDNIGTTPMILVFKNGKYVDGTLGYQEYKVFDKFLNDAGV